MLRPQAGGVGSRQRGAIRNEADTFTVRRKCSTWKSSSVLRYLTYAPMNTTSLLPYIPERAEKSFQMPATFSGRRRWTMDVLLAHGAASA